MCAALGLLAGPLPAGAQTAAAGSDVSAARLEGIDLLPILSGAAPERPRTLFWRNSAAGSTQHAVRQGDWKLLLDGPQEFLFNLSDDVGERNDLAAANGDRVRGRSPAQDFRGRPVYHRPPRGEHQV